MGAKIIKRRETKDERREFFCYVAQFIGLDGNEWDSHLRCLIGFDRSAPPIQGRKPVPIKSYPILFGAQNTTRHSEAWNKPWESPSFKLKIATSLAALAMTDILFFDFWCSLPKNIYLCDTYSPNRYRTTTLDTMGWSINCLVGQGITMRVPALQRQWDVVVLDSV